MSDPRTLVEALLRVAREAPERAFLDFEGRTFTYGAMAARVSTAAAALSAAGLGHGDRVALYLENSPAFVESYLGALWLGAVTVPVNTRYRQEELRHILSNSGARLAVTDPAGLPELEKVRDDAREVRQVIVVGRGTDADVATWEGLGGGRRAEPAAIGPGDLAMIGYTSGTTGRSKGAMLTHGGFCANSASLTRAWGWTAADRLLLTLPLFHMHGLGVGLHGTLVQGSRVTVTRRFEALETVETLARGEHTMFFGVPTMYVRLLAALRATPLRPRGLRLLVSGSAPLSPETFAAVQAELGLPILERYGMTETVMNTGNPLAGPRKPGSVGVPFNGVSVRVVDPGTGVPQDDGLSGEIQIRGPNVFAGYFRNEEATREAFTADGWFRTGDLGYRDADGFYFLNGRARELIISGGFNVYPREVEEVLERHPDVAEAAVVGIVDPDLGERVVAAVVSRSASPDAEALRRHCGQLLAGFKKPREVVFLPELPRNAMGKIQKHVLKERLLTLRAASTPPPAS